MEGIFKRLGRLARAEVGGLRDKLRSKDPEVTAAEAELAAELRRREAAASPPASGSGFDEPSRWPREVLEAYAALEVPVGSPSDAVRAGYVALVQRYHPDRHQQSPDRLDTANELTRRLREQYELLLAFLAARGR